RDLAELARLDRRGYTEVEMARLLGVSPGQISYDKKKLVKRYQAAQQHERQVYVEEAVARLRDVLTEIWSAWDGSKTETRSVPAGKDGERIEVTLPANPEAGYMRRLLEALDRIAELRGIAPDKAGTIIQQLLQVDWSEMAKPTDDLANTIDAKLAEAESLP